MHLLIFKSKIKIVKKYLYTYGGFKIKCVGRFTRKQRAKSY